MRKGSLFGLAFRFRWLIHFSMQIVILAGLGYGLVESFVAGYVSTRAREIVGFGLVIAVLIARPWGLLGEKPSRRV